MVGINLFFVSILPNDLCGVTRKFGIKGYLITSDFIFKLESLSLLFSVGDESQAFWCLSNRLFPVSPKMSQIYNVINLLWPPYVTWTFLMRFMTADRVIKK